MSHPYASYAARLRAVAKAATATTLLVTATLVSAPVRADVLHVIDGMFTGPEWLGPNVNKAFFPASGLKGNAYLYVDQGFSSPAATTGSPDTLYLMYDYVGTAGLGTDANSFFDIFFEVPNDNSDYLTRILPGVNQFQAFERPHGSPAPLLPGGAFDLSAGSGWTPLSPTDLQRANFRTATGINPSPDLATPHLMAEFALSINNAAAPGRKGGDGVYDPDPAFWGAGSKPDSRLDPPISSGIFQLNPDGSTIVTPALGQDGGPVVRPQDVAAPEPGTIALLLAGVPAIGMVIRRRKR